MASTNSIANLAISTYPVTIYSSSSSPAYSKNVVYGMQLSPFSRSDSTHAYIAWKICDGE
jgi:hypothetical protein